MASGKTDYETMTVDQLQAEARRRGISGTSRMRKEQLIETIRGDSGDGSGRSGSETRRPPEEMADERHLKYAKWINAPNEREDYSGQTLATRNHDVIRAWAEARHAKPATITGTEHDDHLGVLRMNFPGYEEGGNLVEVSWDDWFKTFDERNLVFIYQEHRTDGKMSNFFRLDSPEREDA